MLLAELDATCGLETEGTLANMLSRTLSLLGLAEAIGAMNPNPAVSGLLDQMAGLVHSGGIIFADTMLGHATHLTCTNLPVSELHSLKHDILQSLHTNSMDVGLNSSLDLASLNSLGSPDTRDLELADMGCSTPNAKVGG